MSNSGFYLECLIGTIVAISVIMGAFRGLISEVVSLLVWVCAVLVFRHYKEQIIAQYIAPHINSNLAQNIICFLIILVLCLVGGSIVRFIFGKISSLIGFGFANILGGMLFGFLRSIIIISVVLQIIQAIGIIQEEQLENNSIYKLFKPIAELTKINNNLLKT